MPIGKHLCSKAMQLISKDLLLQLVTCCTYFLDMLLLLLMATQTKVEANPHAKRLYSDLLVNSSYSKLIRPVVFNNDTLTVKLGLRLSQLIGIVSIVSFGIASIVSFGIVSIVSFGIVSIVSLRTEQDACYQCLYVIQDNSNM